MKGVHEPRCKDAWSISMFEDTYGPYTPLSNYRSKSVLLNWLCLLPYLHLSGWKLCKLLMLEMCVTESKISFTIPILLKQTRPGDNQLQVDVPAYKYDVKWDVYHLLTHYVEVKKTP